MMREAVVAAGLCGMAACVPAAPAAPPTPTPADVAILRSARTILEDAWAGATSGSACADASVVCPLGRAAEQVTGMREADRPAAGAFRSALGAARLAPGTELAALTGRERSDLLAALAAETVELERRVAAAERPAPVTMVPYTLVTLTSGTPVPPDSIELVRDGHFAALAELERAGELVFAGPVLSDAFEGIMLLRAVDPALALERVGGDPAIRAGALVARAYAVWLPAGLGWPNPKYGAPGCGWRC